MDSNYTCLTEINLDSALKRDEKYYQQMFSKACKYIEGKVMMHITQEIEIISIDLDEE